MSVALSQSLKLLKSVVSTGRVFVWPIQKDLELDLDEVLVPSLQVSMRGRRALISLLFYPNIWCNVLSDCGMQVSVQELRKHVQACKLARLKFLLTTVIVTCIEIIPVM